MTILTTVPVISIIDDDASVRTATGALVRSLGFTVQVFASAEEFLKSARADDMSCLITDVQMPGMSGLELQRVLAAQGSRTPIIFITAFPEARIRSQAEAAGAAGFLVKPFDEDAMIACLDRALQQRTTPAP
jgi:FixJ family two-component response regulator